MKVRDDLLVEYVKSALMYDAETGIFRWKVRSDMPPHWNRRYAGQIAGCKRSIGYVSIYINNRPYLSHRLGWVIMKDEWPPAEIDHINGDRYDCSWKNLRLASRVENSRNVPNTGRNKSGFKGVSFDKGMKAWVARIKIGEKYVVLGYGKTPEQANALYVIAAMEYHQEFCSIRREP